MKFRFALIAMFSAVLGLGACQDPIELEANLETTTDTLTVYALSGTPPGYPSALSIIGRTPVTVTTFGGFDVAFDIDPAGRVLVHAARRVISLGPQLGLQVPQVGLQIVSGTFESNHAAPTTGYKVDSTIVASVGEVIMIEAVHNNGEQDVCTFALSPNLYAKITIDEVFLATRTIRFRLGLDPNCGFRSFLPGIPTE